MYFANTAGAPALDYIEKTAIVLKADQPSAYYDKLVTALREGLNANITEVSLCDISKSIDPVKVNLLIIPDAADIPYGTLCAVDGFLHGGGSLLTLGGPPFNNMSQTPCGKAPDTPAIISDELTPEYKFYPITNGAKAVAFNNQAFVATRNYTIGANPVSVNPRPEGTGYGNKRNYRFVPLIEVYDGKGLRSGFLAWMVIGSTVNDNKYPYNGSIIAGFGANDAAFYDDSGCAAVLETARAMLGDCFISEGGTDEYLYVDSETDSVKVGVQLASVKPEGYTVEIDLVKDGIVIRKEKYSASDMSAAQIPGFSLLDVSFEHAVSAGKPDTAVVTLKKDGQTADRIAHGIKFWSPLPAADRKYVTVSDNEFMLDGKPLRLFGVNYMPSSGVSVNAEHHKSFLQYICKAAYDPDNFYKDLLRVKEVGFNAVSLFVYYEDAVNSNNMIDLIRMCGELGIYVDLSIRPHADPFDFNGREVIEMIQRLRLDDLTDLVAYDIAWERTLGNYEPSYGNAAGRKSYDSLWEQWIIGNYGSVDNAETEWDCQVPRTSDGAVTSPGDNLFNNDGEFTKLMSAYRLFIDGLVSQRHSYACDLIRKFDPNHLISARTISTSGVPIWTPGFDTGYDFGSLAAAFDFFSPECYGMTTETAEQGIFTNIYARYNKPGTTVVWKEFGQSIWNGSNFGDNKVNKKSQADYYTAIYNMAISGHSGGIYSWYWPGGYRIGENSDYGVINPDGSDRPVTKVIREYSGRFTGQPVLGEPDTFFNIDRLRSATGTSMIYAALGKEILTAVNAGSVVAFTDNATGTDTASVPEDAIGGGVASNTNPARWASGLFRSVSILMPDGTWAPISDGGSVTLRTGSAVMVRIAMTNMMNSKWLSESAAGAVSLKSSSGSDLAFDLPLTKDVSYLQTYTQQFTLTDNLDGSKNIAFRFGIKGRFSFGAPFKFTVTAE